MGALIWTVFADKQQAKGVVAILLEEQLIACANIMPGMESIFLWEGNIDAKKECGTLLKTDGRLLKSALSRLEHLHPYQTPAILGWRCSEVGIKTDKWLRTLTGSNGHEENSPP